MPRKPSRKTLKNKLDKIFSEKVRERGKCERCGATERLQCSHIFTRRKLSVRWDIDNAHCLCARCHMWWHHNPAETYELIMKTHGEEKFKKLRDKANAPRKWTDKELNELYLELCQTKL